MRCRTVYRATCSSIYVIWALQLTSVFFGHRSYFYVDTCCVWGGFGRFRPASTWRHNPVPLFHRYRGGITQGTPPLLSLSLLCFISATTNRQPPTQTNEFVINSSAVGLFFRGFFFCGEQAVLRSFFCHGGHLTGH